LPLFFTPFKHNGIDLIDGGVLNPVPIAPTFSDSTDLTIAVNLGGMVEAKDKIEIINKQKSDETSAFPEQFSGPFTEAVTEYVGRLTDSIAGGVNQDWDAYDIANQAFDAMQSTIARQKLAAYPADVNIEIARNACGTLEFDRASEMIDLGYAKAQESLGSLLN
jgi:NTE family protein